MAYGARVALARFVHCYRGALLGNKDYHISPFRPHFHVRVLSFQLT